MALGFAVPAIGPNLKDSSSHLLVLVEVSFPFGVLPSRPFLRGH